MLLKNLNRPCRLHLVDPVDPEYIDIRLEAWLYYLMHGNTGHHHLWHVALIRLTALGMHGIDADNLSAGCIHALLARSLLR